jgi:hypothetical protein
MLINVRLETAALKADMANLEAKFKGLGNTVSAQQNPMRNFGKSLLAAAGVGMTLTALVGFTKSVIAAGVESQKSDKRLDQIATSMGIFGDATLAVTGRLKDFADAQARLTGVDDDVIKRSQAKLLTFKHLAESAGTMGGAFDRATQATIDMAAAGFGEAEQNAVQLGKALEDPIKGITALSRSGITFTEQEKNKIKTLVQSNKMMEAQAYVLKAIETQVGGTAAATASATDKMAVAYGQVEEAIGLALMPMLDGFANWFVETAPLVEDFFKQLNDPTTTVGKSWGEMEKSVDNVGFAIGRLFTAMTSGKSSGNGFIDLITFMNTGIGGIIALAADGVTALKNFITLGHDAFTMNWKQGLIDISTMSHADPFANWNSYLDKYRANRDALIRDAAAQKQLDDAKALFAGDANPYVGGGGGGGGGGGNGETTAQKNKRVALAYLDTVNTKVAAATKKYNDTVMSAQATYNERSSALYAKHAEDMAALEASHADRVAEIQKSYAQKLKDVIQQSMDELRNAFKQATATDVGSMFKDLAANGQVSADQLIATLKDRLTSIKKLADDAAKLSGLGFSQTFIQQVIAQGPQVGDQLAQSLMAATPEAQKQLQDLFGESEKVSETGMDSLAKSIYDKSGLATSALKTLYSQTQAELATALAEEQAAYESKVAAINKTLADGLAKANTELNDSLAKAAKSLNDTLDTLDAAMTKKLASLKGKLGGVQGQIAATRDSLYGAYADTAYVAPDTTAALAAGENSIVAGLGVRNSTASTSVNVYAETNASPALIADSVVAALKFGAPLSMMTR